ncbi:hypothetical protein HNQ59_000382 [Chitinivorax tropicus]|uniref:Esterase n=1 Tax=Chitinivorax tropicus TaxID=714531 RepID=A0A840MFE1_9PROT|nr:YqiA/YcfP family alpha/beta fold hydrolase [Chitinivorax tropicus]MBB5017120.1 hypothetical protein [Chitinivorax tropicus]
MIIYLHGFMSGPGSFKATQMRDFMAEQGWADEYQCPKLSPYPAQAMAALSELIAALPVKPGLIGSSLGGYYALYLARKFECRAVLVNPAIKPYQDLQRFLGPQVSPYTGEAFTLTESHMDELRSLETPSPERLADYWLLTQTGDEVLDYRLAVDKLMGVNMTIEVGGDHSFVHFERHLRHIVNFLTHAGT